MSRHERDTGIVSADKTPAVVKPALRVDRGIWSVLEAKAKLSEILRLARAGKPQTIDAQDPCVVISGAAFEGLRRRQHLGKFLLSSAPRLDGMELPSRADERGDSFSEARRAAR
jgi:antitoxin (DNA-binding transcriptional repressor) of toxin-antitoxin stability system